jgi:SAM-dependent methyltransferase
VKPTESRWTDYYNRTNNSPPRETLLKAIALFAAENRIDCFAIDLGCGAGSDTLELLRAGWRVLALDRQPEAIQWLISRLEPGYRDKLTTQIVSFEQAELPAADLINASYALPFCRPASFAKCWQCLTSSIRAGGRFAGQLFGPHDSWASDPDMTFHTLAQCRDLLRDFELDYFFERDSPGQTAAGQKKHWHVYSIVARKV